MKLGETPKITVAIRKRPLNKKELQRNETDIVKMGTQGQVIISEYNRQKVDLTKYLEETTFNFDFAYDQHSNNEQIYVQSVRPLIENAFKGAKITCFAYGQTGSGKTYTMKGDMSKNVPGIYYLGAKQIFRLLEQPQNRHLQINVTFYQIYCGKLYDLLNNRNILNIRQDNKGNINVIGLNQKYICSAEEFLDIIEEGSVLRVTSQNNANDDSSRSHAILQISLKEKNKNFSKISFIDLAGNERGADHMDQRKQTKIDGAEINKSLLSLKECIRALDQGKSHTPFRGSKLTMVLKDSFIGYCNTVMICNVSPNNSSSQNTMNTLRYADRVKELKRSEEGERLSKQQMMSRQLMLPRANNKNCVKINIERGDDDQDIMNKMDMARAMHQNSGQNRMMIEEKMDIQEPNEYKKPNNFAGLGRKTENLSNDVKLFDLKKMQVPANGKPRTNASEGYALRGKDLTAEHDKQPLLSRNVRTKIGQNNINTGNGYIDLDKRNKPYLPNQNTNPFPQYNVNVNKTHFQAMNNLRNDFTNYREDHEILFNREMALIKEELNIKNQYREIQSGANYEEQIGNVNNYLRQMEKMISEKEEIINIMRANVQKMKYEVKNAEGATSKLRYEQNNEYQKQQNSLFNNNNVSNNTMGGNVTGCKSQTRLYVHSSLNGMQFNGFNNYGGYNDEQLLQGLPGDESINRLF